MNSELNRQFIDAVEGLVAQGGTRCANCGGEISIVNSLIHCTGCRFGAFNLPIDTEPYAEMERIAKAFGQRMVRTREECFRAACDAVNTR